MTTSSPRWIKRLAPTLAVILVGSLACEDVSVSAVPIESIEVQPESATLLVGETLEMSYVARDANDRELKGRIVEWAVRDGTLAQVRSNGIVEALAAGETIVEARSEGVTGEALIEIRPAPEITMEPSAVEFTAVERGSDPSPQTVQIQNTGDGTLGGLNLLATEYGEGQPQGWLDRSLSGPTAPAELTLRADIGSLSDGTYTAAVPVQSDAASNSPQRVTVTLTVEEAPPSIRLERTSWSPEGEPFFGGPVPTEILVTNGGGSTLTDLAVDSIVYQEDEGDWLVADLEATTAPTRLYMEAYSYRPFHGVVLRTGEYRATVYLSSPVASNSPQTVSVTFLVSDGDDD